MQRIILLSVMAIICLVFIGGPAGAQTPGTERWFLPTGYMGGYSSPAIGADGTIYVGGGDDRKLYAVNPNGTQKWAFTTTGNTTGSPAIGADGTIYEDLV